MHIIHARGGAAAALVLGAVALSWSPCRQAPCPQGVEQGVEKVPSERLSANDWTGLRSAYDAGRHAAHAVADGFEARNPGQQWLTKFDSRGFLTLPDHGEWTWGLTLERYGFEGFESTVTKPLGVQAEGGRVAYRWSPSLEEWFKNDKRGLEHGFTVFERPAHGEHGAAGPLKFSLAVRGGLRPEVADQGRSVRFLDDARSVALTYAGLCVFDATGRELDASFALDDDGLQLCVEEQEAHYPLTIDPIAQQAYLKASNIGANDRFGAAVAMSGNTIVIGAPGEDSNATGVNGNQANNSASASGAAYVFAFVGGSWTQQAYLKASNTGAGDEFGSAVAISGNTIVIGAKGEDSNATGVNGNQTNNSASASGAAYVFGFVGGSWTQLAYLKASNTQTADSFGVSVAVSGNTVAVGATQEDSFATGVNGAQGNNSKPESGAAYVFVWSAPVWSQQAYVKASNTDGGDRFATSVSVSGNTLVVGAPNESSTATGVNGNQASNGAGSAGSAYVFFRSGTIWSQQAYLKASNTGTNDQFGGAVAVDDDTIVVGAAGEDSSTAGLWGDQANNGALSAGAAYVFARSGSTWSQKVYLKASNASAFDTFGRSVAVSGDTILVGAPGEDSNATGLNGNQADNTFVNSGAAYVFARRGPGFSQWAYVKPSNTGFFDAFGESVSVSGQAFVVGAGNEKSANGNQTNNSAANAGAGYAFSLPKSVALGSLSYLSPKHVIQATFSGASSTLTTEFTAGRRPWTLKVTVGSQTVTGTPPLTLTGIPPGKRNIVVEAIAPGGPWGTLEHYSDTTKSDYEVSAKNKNEKSYRGSSNCEGTCPAINGKPDCNSSITNGKMVGGTKYAVEFTHQKDVTLRELLIFAEGNASQAVTLSVYNSSTPKTTGGVPTNVRKAGANPIMPGSLVWYGTKLASPEFVPKGTSIFFVFETAVSNVVTLPILVGDAIEMTLSHSIKGKSASSWKGVSSPTGWALCFLCNETATDCPINDTDGETVLGASITFKLANARPGQPAVFLFNTAFSVLPNLAFLNAPACSSLNPITPLIFPIFTTSTSGSVAVPVPIPNAPPLTGTKFHTQWLGIGDLGTPNPGGVTLSNLLEHEIGR